MSERVLHCWKDEREAIGEKFGDNSEEYWATYREGYIGGTCMLERDHVGAHQFTRDDQIGVRFGPQEPDTTDTDTAT